MQIRFTPDAGRLICYEIEQANGNEVFFVADLDDSGLVLSAQALARGNRKAVPALLSRASHGQMVLHNHPSGDLTPSDADLDLASVCGNNGIGFGIINNQCSDCYLVVVPHRASKAEPIDTGEVERLFKSSGMLSRQLKGFEQRDEQLQMALAVTNAFNNRKVAVIEAGTGTGKSLAYLVPALLWAIKNDQKVVISTNTINLQEQLIKKDIPLLQRQSAREFSVCLVKGRGNYLCLRKLEAVQDEPTLFPDSASEELQAIMAWRNSTNSGCLSTLSFQPTRDVWDDLRCEGDQCTRSRCSQFNHCFFYKARRDAASAQLLVVNHALLMADIALRSDSGYDSTAILPPFKHLILDEAHHLEDAATNALSVRISRAGLLKQLSRLAPSGKRAGLLTVLNNKVAKGLPEEQDGLYQEFSALVESLLLPLVSKLAGQIDQDMDWLALNMQTELLHGDDKRGGELKRRITSAVQSTPFWHSLTSRLEALKLQLQDLVDGLGAMDRVAARMPDSLLQSLNGLLTDTAGIALRMSAVIHDLSWFCGDDPMTCRWLEVRQTGRGSQASICIAPLEVAEAIKSSLFDPLDTVILTSATLTVGESFSYLARRTGLDLLDQERLLQLLLPSSFDFASQALVAVPADLPEPTSRDYLPAIIEAVQRVVSISRGGAFILFTSYDLLRQVFEATRDSLELQGFELMRQGEAGGSRHALLSRFRKSSHGVLFGTDSFWEGVDVQGDALRLVVIARLPFQVPTEPIQQARSEQIKADGGDPFREMSIPQAVLKLRQGFGRLIRSRNDRGAVLILDSRMVTKNYGPRFRKSLPLECQTMAPLEDVLKKMELFYRE